MSLVWKHAAVHTLLLVLFLTMDRRLLLGITELCYTVSRSHAGTSLMTALGPKRPKAVICNTFTDMLT